MTLFRRLGLTGALWLGALLPLTAQTAQVPEWDVQAARGRTREVDFTTSEGSWMSTDASPDGRWIVFDLLGHIYRIPAQGGAAECLTQGAGAALSFDPRYSPDGSKIAFISDRAGQNNLWVMNADGSNARSVFLDPVTRLTEPAWTPDGTAIVAVRHFPTYSMHRRSARIWKFTLDGGAEELVGAPSGTQAYWPSVSPDGRFMYYQFATFAEPLHGRQRMQHIRRYDLSTGAVSAVTAPESDRWYWSEGAIEMAPEVSPDGRWLAFARRIPGATTSWRGQTYRRRTALWLRDLATGAERILMDPITLDMAEAHGMKNLRILPGHAWAKDSKSMVLSQGGRLRRVWVADGRVETIPFTARVQRTVSEQARSQWNITDQPFDARLMRWPSSTPDGRTVVFGAVGFVWVVTPAGGTPRRVTTDASAGVELMPVVSPDGQWVAYVTWDDAERGHVWKAPLAGGAPQRLTSAAGEYLAPAWSPDGQSLWVTRGTGATARGQPMSGNLEFQLVRIPVAGGEPLVVRSPGPAVGISFGPGGRVYFTEQRSPGDVQVPLAQGRPIPESYSTLVSVAADGKDRKEHVRVSSAEEMVPSPDGKWVAFRDEYNVFLVPFRRGEPAYVGPLQWSASTPARFDTDAIRQVSFAGGYNPRWRTATSLEFLSGNRYIVHDVTTGRSDTVRIKLPVPKPIPAGTIALTNARIITLENRAVIERGTIVVRGSRIECVGRCDVSGAGRVLDLAGKTVVPGFVDVHAHHVAGGGIPEHRQHRYESAVYLAYGVTTTLDPSADPISAFALAEMVDAGRIVGPRTFSTGDVLMPPAGTTGPQTYEEMARIVDRLADWGAISIKFYLAPTRQQRQWVAEAARRRGLSVTNEGADLTYNLSCILDGHTGWEHPMMYLPLYDDAAKFFGKANAVYSPTLTVAGAGYWAEEYRQARADLWNDPKQRRFMPWDRLVRSINSAERPLEEYSFPMMAHAVADLIHAGGHASLGGHGEQMGLDSHWEIWNYASALTPMEALEVASRGGAYMTGLDDDLGSIKVGKLADLVVLNTNPLEDIRRTTDIRYVMKGGVLHDADTLDELWPERRPYGPIPWTNTEVFRSDTRAMDYWDKR